MTEIKLEKTWNIKKGERIMKDMKAFEIKKALVESDKSRIYKDWNARTGISKEDFIKGLEWLHDDPKPDGKCTRRLAIDVSGKLHRWYKAGDIWNSAFYEDGKLAIDSDYVETDDRWGGYRVNRPSITVEDKI